MNFPPPRHSILRHLDLGTELFVRNLWRERRLFSLAVLFACTGALFEGTGLGLLVPFLQSLIEPDAVISTGWVWFDQWVLAIDRDPVWRLYQISTLILVSIGLRVAFAYASTWVSVRMRENIGHRLRCQLIEQMQDVSLGYFSRKRAGDYLNNLTAQIGRLRHLFDQATHIMRQFFLMVVYVGAIFLLSWQLAVFAMVFCGFLFMVLNGLLSRLREKGQDIYETDGMLLNIASEIVGGMRTIASFGTKKFESDRFKTASAANAEAQVVANRRGGLVGPLSQGIASVALILLIIVAVQFFVLTGKMSAAALLAFFFALFRLLPLVQMLNGARSQWAISRSAIDEIADMLRRDDKPYLVDGTQPFTGLNRGIEIDNVDFGYEPGQRVLQNINLFIAPYETTAIVGSSGSGKTTLADLIIRLHDPVEGSVLFDGVDLREYRIQTLRRQVAVVSQYTFLFNDTVTNNIAYGMTDVSMERVRWAAEKSNSIEFIEQMDKGFDTTLGERGERLSGGQRQRISIARALLRDPDILVLDEATSSLDSVTEQLVKDSLDYLMRDRTVIVIAHRLSTIENADRIIVLEDGRIVEEGTYDDLLTRKGMFWKYHSLQYQAA
jgi:subfamily B ATP-binding cassette protein MsbA